ncbi:MAG: preprotein translocase subunit YajC [Bacteroidales bacterium]
MNNLFLLMAPAQGGQQGGGSMTLIFILLIILVFYFFMIRPQQKKQKQVQKYRESLQRGDKIITIGGIHGKITDVQETTFTIEVEDGTKMKIEKAAVAVDGNEVSKKKEEK